MTGTASPTLAELPLRPELVGEVAFAGWTADGRMRHPSWRGLRDDLDPEEVREEWQG